MNSKERVQRFFRRETVDRVPIDYMANPNIDLKLKKHFNLQPTDNDGLREALNVDIRYFWPRYTGKRLHPNFPERGVMSEPATGERTRYIEHVSGGYWESCDYPLEFATCEDVQNWAFPNPDDYDYKIIVELSKKYHNHGFILGHQGCGCVINMNGLLRGQEQALMDLALDDEAGLFLAERRINLDVELLYRSLEAGKGQFDAIFMGEDLGTQIAPMISMDSYRKHIKILHQKIIDVANTFDLPVMMHTCGSSSWVYDEFIKMGVAAVDALQPEAKNMEPRYLKERFGNNLAFHGCISTTGALTFGTPEEVKKDCNEVLEIMKVGGGYCFSPAHSIQDNSPVENVLAMYETAFNN